MASARTCSTEKQTRPGRGFFFPSLQKGKFKETSVKQGRRCNELDNVYFGPVVSNLQIAIHWTNSYTADKLDTNFMQQWTGDF